MMSNIETEKEKVSEPHASDPSLAIELRRSSVSSSDIEEGGGGTDVERAVTSKSERERKVTRVVTAQDWTGPDDPENPHNWSTFKKTWHVIQPALFGFAVTFGSSVYSSAAQDISTHFHVSNTAALVGVTLYVIGLGFGPVLAAPVSETFGRLVVYRLSLPLSMLFTLGVGFSNSFGGVLVCRFFAGLFGSPVLSVGAGTNADLFLPKDRAKATIWFLLAPFLGTAVGPIVGGYCAEYKGWRWTQWSMLFVFVATYMASLPMKETYKKTILQKRAKRLGIEPPKSNMPSGLAAIKFLLTVTLFRPIHMLLFEPIVGFLSLYSAFTFGVLFAFLPAFPLVYQGVYHFDLGHTGLTFISLGLGICLGVPTALLFDRLMYQKAHRAAAKLGKHAAPEHRLYSAMMGGFGVTIGLFWFGWAARKDVHWIVPVLGAIPFGWGNISIFAATALYTIDVYGPLNGASAIGANSLARYLFGSIFPLFTVQMYKKLSIGWASSLLGFVSLAMLPIPWVIYKWGKQIRAKSAYDTFKD